MAQIDKFSKTKKMRSQWMEKGRALSSWGNFEGSLYFLLLVVEWRLGLSLYGHWSAAEIRNTQKAEAAELLGMKRGTQNPALSSCPLLTGPYLPLKLLRAESRAKRGKFGRVRGQRGERNWGMGHWGWIQDQGTVGIFRRQFYPQFSKSWV